MNFFHNGTFWANTHSHPTPRDPVSPPPRLEQEDTWITEAERGSRHRLDIAPFSLWSIEEHDYNEPTQAQAKWILTTYKANMIEFIEPFIVISTECPSLPDHNGLVTLTIGCAPAIFISKQTGFDGFHAGPPLPNALIYCDPFLPDPLLDVFQSQPYTEPSIEETQMILDHLRKYCSVHAMNFVFPKLIIELANNGRAYQQRSLPARVGGWSTLYHHQQSDLSYWDSVTSMGRTREMSATRNVKGDDTNYLFTGNRVLGPGVRVEGAASASTAGVRIRNGNQIRITLAAHSFKDCERVFHPNGDNGDSIAEIKERYVDEDWVLAELHPSIAFDNSQVFECPTPERLLRSNEMKEVEWYICDGMTTGKVAMMYSGCRLVEASEPGGEMIWVSKMTPQSIYFTMGPTGGAPEIRSGICGAAIVHEKGNGVAGFFQWINRDGYCFSPRLDKLIDDGWACY
jgi:hypothetical protein